MHTKMQGMSRTPFRRPPHPANRDVVIVRDMGLLPTTYICTSPAPLQVLVWDLSGSAFLIHTVAQYDRSHPHSQKHSYLYSTYPMFRQFARWTAAMPCKKNAVYRTGLKLLPWCRLCAGSSGTGQ